jgi:hypothetical protein
MDVVLRDPTYQPPAAPGVRERIADGVINDRRDIPFLGLMTLLTVTVIPTAVALYLPGPFRWWLAAVHLGLVVWFLGPFILMLHNTSHRRLFRRPYGWMNFYIPWVLGPFFGESPETYFGHHVGMHHPENNLEDDLSSTMHYQRDSAVDFARYFLDFFFLVFFKLLAYFGKKGRRSLMIRVAVGETLFYVVMAGLLFLNWRATLFVVVLPFLISRFGMMAGNWAQHAFIDSGSPENCYRNSITCINSTYNRRCFNDGYHIGHHVKANRHWTEMPEDFQRNIRLYDAEGALVFTGVDFFQVWGALMLRKYDWLAHRLVQLGETPRPHEELVTLLKTRTKRIDAVAAS